jgi:hypothetical protein
MATQGEVNAAYPLAMAMALGSLERGSNGALSVARASYFGAPTRSREEPVDGLTAQASLPDGAPLEGSLRARMEAGLGHSFGDVRVHTGAEAEALTDALSARAFTVGRDIAFAPSQYRPGTATGDGLIAHELAHVVQQSESVAPSPLLSPNGSRGALPVDVAALEADASRAAARALVGALPHGPELRSPAIIQKADAMTELDPTYAEAKRPTDDPLMASRNVYYLDLNGDQAADHVLRLSVSGFWPTHTGSIQKLDVELEQIQPNAKVKKTFDVPSPDCNVHTNVKRLERSDGDKPVQLDLTFEREKGNRLLLLPPKALGNKSQVLVTAFWTPTGVGNAGLAVPYEFPAPAKAAETPRKYTVFKPQNPRSVGGMWALDFLVGAFGDPMRMTFYKANSSDTIVIIGILPLAGGVPTNGQRYEFKQAPPKALNVGLAPGDNLELAIDLDGDGSADIKFLDRLEVLTPKQVGSIQPKADAAKNRAHNFVVRAAYGWGDIAASIPIEDGRYKTDSWLYGGGGPDFDVTSQAVAVDSLPEQQKKGTFGDQVATTEAQRGSIRQLAKDKKLISDTLFAKWLALSDAVLALQIAAGQGKPTLSERAQAAGKAREFVNELTDTTKGEREKIVLVKPSAFKGGGGSLTLENPYTGARRKLTHGLPGNTLSPADAEVMATKLVLGDVDSALFSYGAVATRFDAWIEKRLRDNDKDSKEAAYLENLAFRDKQLQEIAKYHPEPVAAVFHPRQVFADKYRIEEIPLSLFYWSEGSNWYLRDFTNPQKVFNTHYPKGAETEPPHALFETMNRATHFVKGRVHYRLPNGVVRFVEMTEDKEWSDYFAYAAAALGAAAFVLATAGAGSIVVTAVIVGASAAGAISAGLDIKEKSEQGILTTEDVVLDVAQIAAALLGGLSAVARNVKVLQQAALAGKELSAAEQILAKWGTVSRLYKPITIAAMSADAINLLVYLPKAAEELEAIEKSPGTEGDRFKAKALLMGRLFAQGAMTILSVRGNWRELEKLGSWEVGFLNGKPVARVPKGTPGYATADYEAELKALLKGTPAEKVKTDLEVLPADKFEGRFKSATSDAVTVMENGKPKVYVREGAAKSALAEEARHVQQAHDPILGPTLRVLDEAKMLKWPTLSAGEKLAMVRAKLTAEIDVQQGLIKELGAKSSLSQEEYLRLDNAWQNVENLRAKFGEWGELEAQLAKTQKVAGDAELLKQPPRLFSKPALAAFDLDEGWRNLSPDDFLAKYKARYPNTGLTDAELLARFEQGKRLNPKTWKLAGPGRREKLPPDVSARVKAGSEKVYGIEERSADGEKLELSSSVKQERQKLLAERDAARAERDLKLKVGDEAAAGKARYKVNEASRKLGELHAEAYMAEKHPDFVKKYPPPGSKSRSGDFDQVWQRVKKTPQGDVTEYLRIPSAPDHRFRSHVTTDSETT